MGQTYYIVSFGEHHTYNLSYGPCSVNNETWHNFLQPYILWWWTKSGSRIACSILGQGVVQKLCGQSEGGSWSKSINLLSIVHVEVGRSVVKKGQNHVHVVIEWPPRSRPHCHFKDLAWPVRNIFGWLVISIAWKKVFSFLIIITMVLLSNRTNSAEAWKLAMYVWCSLM